jgi:hypothetical protein
MTEKKGDYMSLCLRQKFKSGGMTWIVRSVEFDPPYRNKRWYIEKVLADPVPQEPIIRTDEEINKKIRDKTIEPI